MILLDICELIVDCPHSTAKDEGHGFPLIRTPNIGKGRLILDNVHRVCKEVYDKRNIRAIPQVDDIILAREAPAGNAALITKGQKVCLGQRTVLIRPNINKVNPEYLVYYMLSPKVQHDLKSSANGATVAHINMPKIRNLKIQIPNRVIQDKIATILSRYDALIENYQKQIKLLEESAQRLYKEWFVDLRFPGHENTKIVDDGVPEGWEKKEINEFISILSGYAFKSSSFVEDGDYKIVTIKNVQDGFFDGKNLSHIRVIPNKMPKHCFLTTGDLLLSLTGNIGRVCMVIGNNYLLNQRVAKIESVFPAFAYCLFRSENMFTSINNLANGAAQQNVSPIKIGTLKIVVNNEIIFKFEKVVGNIRNHILALYSQIEELTEARDRLLPKLMSGEIEV